MTLIAQHTAPAAQKWRVLDLGCGTGLVGIEIAPYASQLVGVDLSEKMLAKAQTRNLYHRLEHHDLVTMMQNEKAESYDLIVSADTFVYVGRLDEVASEARRLLATRGLLACSIESLDALSDSASRHGDPLEFLLQSSPSCRYAHSSAYLRRLAHEYGFNIHQIQSTEIRVSNGKPVSGYLVLMEKIQS